MSERQPRLGIGIDYRNAKDYPHEGGVDGIISGYHDRLSHVQVIDLGSDEQITHIREVTRGLPLIHHLWSVQPTDAEGPNGGRFERQNRMSELADAVWQNEDLGYWTIGPYDAPFFACPVLEPQVAHIAARNLEALNRETTIPFFPENPTCTLVAGSLTMGEFFKRVVYEAEVPLVLDLSHLYSYSLLKRCDPHAALRAFPLETVVELHVAGGYLEDDHAWRYCDTHVHPIRTEVFELLADAIVLCPNTLGVTYEVAAGVPGEVFARDFETAEKILDTSSFIPNLRGAALPLSTRGAA